MPKSTIREWSWRLLEAFEVFGVIEYSTLIRFPLLGPLSMDYAIYCNLCHLEADDAHLISLDLQEISAYYRVDRDENTSRCQR